MIIFQNSGITDCEYIFFSETISKNTLFIIYGFSTLIVDNWYMKQNWNELRVVRYRSKKDWLNSLLKTLACSQCITVIIIVFTILMKMNNLRRSNMIGNQRKVIKD